jgi:hypothetical protein
MRRLLILLIGFAPLPLNGSQHDSFSVWFVDSLVKIFHDTSATPSHLELALVSARNGHASLQVALRSDEHRVVRVRIIAPRLGNAMLHLRSYRIGTVTVNSHPTAQSATSAEAFLRRMVALLMMGRAQKPTLRTNPNVT